MVHHNLYFVYEQCLSLYFVYEQCLSLHLYVLMVVNPNAGQDICVGQRHNSLATT